MKTKVLLIGGINKTQLLAKELLKKGYDVTAINADRNDCLKLAEIDGLSVIFGDGTKPYVLDQADAGEKDIVIAMCRHDSENLVACQMAKMKFGIRKTVALVNDPEHVDFFRRQGIDHTICALSFLTAFIEKEASDEPQDAVRKK
ncbi:MAG TPA: NAD-binding protein [Lachnospiraceae bacterium]|nr:NAD-binding protein [Lachnospiraceae bacterium]